MVCTELYALPVSTVPIPILFFPVFVEIVVSKFSVTELETVAESWLERDANLATCLLAWSAICAKSGKTMSSDRSEKTEISK